MKPKANQKAYATNVKHFSSKGKSLNNVSELNNKLAKMHGDCIYIIRKNSKKKYFLNNKTKRVGLNKEHSQIDNRFDFDIYVY